MHTALQATSRTLADYLEARFQADATLGTLFTVGGLSVSLNTPQEMAKRNRQGLSIWLYRVMRDEQRLNDPPFRVSLTEQRAPPLALRLHYLLTPITDPAQRDSPETEQVILGKAMQAMHSRPTLRGVDLRGDFSGSTVELHTRLETLTLEEIARVWDALKASYQLSVSYEVSVVNIDSELAIERISPVEAVLPEYGVIVS